MDILLEKYKNVLEKILYLESNKGLSDAELEKALKLKPKTISNWKRGTSKSFLKILPQIADYFDVSTEFLLGEAEKKIKKEPSSTDRLAQDIANIFLKKGVIEEGIPLDPLEREALLDFLDSSAEAYKKLRKK